VHPAVKIAIVLLSVTPVPPLLPNMLVKAGGSAAYACGLLVSHSIFAIVVLPLTVELMNLVFGTDAHFGPLAVAQAVVISILLPLAAGLISAHFMGASALRAGRLIGTAGTILLGITLLPLLVVAWQALPVLIGHGALIALALFVITGLVVGHALGGPKRGDRSSLALATVSRHPGLAIAIAIANTPRQGRLVVGAVIIYLLLSVLLFIPYNHWRRKTSNESLDAGTVTAHT
jgi:BASS family bile acid:Na+ symporter